MSIIPGCNGRGPYSTTGTCYSWTIWSSAKIHAFAHVHTYRWTKECAVVGTGENSLCQSFTHAQLWKTDPDLFMLEWLKLKRLMSSTNNENTKAVITLSRPHSQKTVVSTSYFGQLRKMCGSLLPHKIDLTDSLCYRQEMKARKSAL
jgi:hypothetical protein